MKFHYIMPRSATHTFNTCKRGTGPTIENTERSCGGTRSTRRHRQQNRACGRTKRRSRLTRTSATRPACVTHTIAGCLGTA
ncbi:hypothetical protein COLSTE_02353 [Collinsella stercoris DSM 13279]|uniref:Uncharacterized protein n=1 Tax=Collinsella stercoris DSM 13279 TaxID=445975 RepID=B6GE17_9ACTN|nr:hypothetical protein COLSTE_02353 [Collinsella stercoris DSM 13279]